MFQPYLDQFVIEFVNDILIYSRSKEEQIQIHKTYLVAAECMCRKTWLGGAYDSYCTKNLCEDQMLGYDVLISDGYLYV